ncbi:sugar phosphate isomerase/epimerase family protein [Neolewinella litorea]|uniref:Sugar phosphate isomerase/epimerase n=1 Tax=Neolewinella litorea TaxID=2562452 RepID=A0A4S4N6Y4_9BACT|nr:sugar phosphate isomerase/epimerase family protein [Neolewinella litorea]THH34904.1 sugar phosphate isomerase/epimerase [Neolewinella litorea]
MQLGFVTAILPDYTLEEVLRTAADIGYDCVEAMCWPPGKAERRYAGVTHVDVSRLDEAGIAEIKSLQEKYGVFISSLGYYPNPLGGDTAGREAAVAHLHDLIDASAALGIGTVTTFVGRDKDRTIEAQWGDFLSTWRPLVDHAAVKDVRIGIENCPMRFTADEWPGGNNLAVSPAVWERMWTDIPSAQWGLNYDPSHLVLMQMDYTRPFRDYPDRMIHVHAKDLRIDREQLDRHGVFSHPGQWHTPKLPGLGDVDWGRFFGHLTDAGYDGPVCVEVEDRAYEGSEELRLRSLRQSHDYLRQFIV